MNLNNILKKIIKSPVYNIINKTPLNYAKELSKKNKNNIWLKREDLLPIFSFKLRGSYNKIYNLSDDEKNNGIIACSAGNHAQGVAYSAKKMNLNAKIVMPKVTPKIKLDAVKSFGAEIIVDGDNFDQSQDIAYKIMKNENRTLIHPYDDLDVIAGQGTIGLEIIEQINNLKIDHIFCCVGGGGLISGIGTCIKLLRPDIKIIGVEAINSSAMTKSLNSNKLIELKNICTYADGCAVKKVGSKTFEISKLVVDEMINVSNSEITQSIIDGFLDTRTIFEPAGALGLAGCKKYLKSNNLKDTNNIVITSGSNIDFKKLRFISNTKEDTEESLSITIPEKVGSFNKLYNIIHPNNVTGFSYRYKNSKKANIYLSIQTNEIDNIINLLEQNNFDVINLKNNDLANDHLKYTINSNKINNERIFRFQFPENPGSLKKFLDNLSDEFNVTLFHYLNEGGDIAKVLVGLQTNDNFKLNKYLKKLNYKYIEETNNIIYKKILK